jgi:hypothetical protein
MMNEEGKMKKEKWVMDAGCWMLDAGCVGPGDGRTGEQVNW